MADLYDPLELDKSNYAQALREIAEHPMDDHPPEPPHPLEANQAVRPVLDFIEQEELKIVQRYRVTSEASPENPYMQFNEGMMLRLEVIVGLTLLYVRQHPEILNQQ